MSECMSSSAFKQSTEAQIELCISALYNYWIFIRDLSEITYIICASLENTADVILDSGPLSAVVKWGSCTVVPRKIVKIGWDSNFGELLAAVDSQWHYQCISNKDGPYSSIECHSSTLSL